MSAVAVAATALLAACGSQATRSQADRCQKPVNTPQQPFAPSSVWKAPLPSNPALDGASAQIVSQLAAEVSKERTTAGNGPWLNTAEYSVPVYGVSDCQPTQRVTLDGADDTLQQAFADVPLPRDVRPAKGTDGTLVVYQPSRDRLWEFWVMRRQSGGWHAMWGGRMDHVSGNPGHFQGPGPSRSWGASASGIAMLGGLARPAEVRSGAIDHALALSAPIVRASQFTPPAQRTDGKVAPPDGIPEGAHFRIDPSLDLSTLGLTPVGLAFARAAQRYGIIVRDYSANVAFYGEDPRNVKVYPWTDVIGQTPPPELLANFPWDHLQLLKMNLQG
ncbi:MAG: hypothetical protein ACR2NB_01295 [Solirubrobacteraceae bacterium]